MIERNINRTTLIEKLNSIRYEELSELQIHHIFLELGYVYTDHYMAEEDNVNNNEQNDG